MFATNRPLHLLIVLATVVLHASSSADNHQPSSQRRPNRGLVRFADNQHQPAPVAVQSRTTATVAIKPKSSASPTKTKKPSVPARFESKKKPPVNNKPSAAVAAISSKKTPKPVDDKYRNEFEEYMRQQIQQWQIAVVNGQPVSPPAGSQPPGQPPSSVWIQVPANGYYPPPSYPYPPPAYPPPSYPPPSYPPPSYPPPSYPSYPPPAYPSYPPPAYPPPSYPPLQQPSPSPYPPQQPLYPPQPSAPESPITSSEEPPPPPVESSSYAPSETPAGVATTPQPEEPNTVPPPSIPEYPPPSSPSVPEYPPSTTPPEPGTPPPEVAEPDIPEITQAPTDKPDAATELPEVIPAYPDTQQPEQPGIPLYPGQPAGEAVPPSTGQPTDASATDLYKPSSESPGEPATTSVPGTTYAPDSELLPGTTGQPPSSSSPSPSTDALKAQCKEPRGQFPSESSCNKFINCWDDTVVEQTCPAGLAFNPEKRYCDYPANVDCGSRPITVEPENGNSSQCPEGYGTYRSKENCGAFYVCVAGTPVDFVCPGGTNYNEDLKICDYPYRVDCKGLPSNPEPIETGTEVEQPETTYAPPLEVSSTSSSTNTGSTTASSVPLSSAESSPVTEVVPATSTAPAPVSAGNPVAIYNYNLRKIPPSLVNTGVRCSHKSVYRLTPDCSSVTLCRSGFTHILNCGYATSYDIVSQKCMTSQRANCGRSA